jgi:zinc protease
VISYSIKTYDNGLTLIHHPDFSTNLCVSNILYNVGARDEESHKTGFAHLFEHLMFGGSINVPSFDTPLQKAGGENNAFTSNDITNYYITLPSDNIETAMWLESDRMLRLDFSEKSLSVQKGVVIEEFKQRYLNQPYGDAWLKLRPLVYKTHPYQWATIGKEIEHIEKAELSDVVEFFEKFYNPANAVICLAGNISFEKADELVSKWFSDIPRGTKNQNQYPQEAKIEGRRELEVDGNVPQDAFYMVYQMVERTHELYFVFDILSDIFSGSESSRFTNSLIKEQKIFTSVHAYITGDIDKGLFVIEGKLGYGISFEEAEKAIKKEIFKVIELGVSANELEKIKNKVMTSNLFAKTSVLNKAMALCYAHRLGNTELVNSEIETIKNIKLEQIQTVCADYLGGDNYCVLKYKSKQ